jgi:hypothetical protein
MFGPTIPTTQGDLTMRIRGTRKRHLQVELLEGRFALSGGTVLPPNATVDGYSLTDMARETARFTTSGNNLKYYPDTPIQVLYFDSSTETFTTVGHRLALTGSNSFTVSPTTPFYVPLLSVDDSPPVVGKFPADPSALSTWY